MKLSVELDKTSTRRMLEAAPRVLTGQWTRTLQAELERGVGIIQRKYRSAPGGKPTATATAVQQGFLRASYSQRTKPEGLGAVVGEIGLMRTKAHARALVYGAIHESDTATVVKSNRTITRRDGTSGPGYLAIPLDAARRFKTRNALGLAKPPREWPNTFVAKSKRGNLIIFQEQGDRIVPLFVLKQKVTIPPRPGIKPVMRQREPIILQRIVNDSAKVLAGVAT